MSKFAAFLQICLGLVARYSINGVVLFALVDWRRMDERLAAGSVNYDQPLNLCVWVKDAGWM